MKNDLFLPEEAVKEKMRGILSHLGVVCAVATVLVFSALFFTDVRLSAAATLDFTVDFALLYFSSYIMYFSLFETGKEKAEAESAFRALAERREKLFRRYRAEGDSESLFAFCRTLSEKENAERRADLLSDCFLTEAEYAILSEKPRAELSLSEWRTVRKIKRLKTVRITPRMLLAERERVHRLTPLSASPEKMRRRRLLFFILPTAFTALFSVSLAAEVITEPSADVIVTYLLKLFTLFFNGVKGFRAGYAHAECDKTEYMREQCFWLEEYFSRLSERAQSAL